MIKLNKRFAALAVAVMTIAVTALTVSAEEPFITSTDDFTVSNAKFEAVMEIYAKTPHAKIVCSTKNLNNVSNATSKIKITCGYVDSSGNEKTTTYNSSGWSYTFNAPGAHQMCSEVISVHTVTYNGDSNYGWVIY